VRGRTSAFPKAGQGEGALGPFFLAQPHKTRAAEPAAHLVRTAQGNEPPKGGLKTRA